MADFLDEILNLGARETWDYGGRSVGEIEGLLTSANRDQWLRQYNLDSANRESGEPYQDLFGAATRRYQPQVSAQQQADGGGVYDMSQSWRTGLPQGWSDIAVDPANRIAWGVGSDGRLVPGSNWSLAANEDDFAISALAMMGGAAYGAMGGAGAGASAGAGTGDFAAGAAATDAGASAWSGAGMGEFGAGAAATDAGAGTWGGGSSAAPVGGASTGGVTGGGTGGNWWDNILGSLGNGDWRQWANLLSGLYGMNRASQTRDEMDPFRQYRQYYGNQLMELEANPNSITSRPGWRAGTEAITREMTSRGYMGSGNHAVGLQRFGGEFFNQELQRLAGLAGAGQSPGAGMGQSNQLTNSSLAAIGYGLAPFSSNRTRVGTGGSYYGGGYTNPGDDPAGTNTGG